MTGLNVTFKQFPLTVVGGEWNRAGSWESREEATITFRAGEDGG